MAAARAHSGSFVHLFQKRQMRDAPVRSWEGPETPGREVAMRMRFVRRRSAADATMEPLFGEIHARNVSTRFTKRHRQLSNRLRVGEDHGLDGVGTRFER